MIKYDNVFELFKKAGITSYTIRKQKIIGQATYQKLKTGGIIDTRTIDRLCEVLNCQPGDILTYKKDVE